ncbi:MAG: hypothetical protein V5A87_07760 [Candidatus Bipolaricaulota bacterium]
MNKKGNEASKFSAIKQIYRENYLEDISHRMRKEAENEKKNCS